MTPHEAADVGVREPRRITIEWDIEDPEIRFLKAITDITKVATEMDRLTLEGALRAINFHRSRLASLLTPRGEGD